MLSLSNQERRAVLFLLTIALTGLCIDFFAKTIPGIQGVVKINERTIGIDINKASYADLRRIRGVTGKLAQKIIEYRKEHGSFRDIEELKEIKGIGDYRYERLRAFLFVE